MNSFLIDRYSIWSLHSTPSMYFNSLMNFSWLGNQMTSNLFCFYKAMSYWTFCGQFHHTPLLSWVISLWHRSDPTIPYPVQLERKKKILRRPLLTWPFTTSLSSSATSSHVLSSHPYRSSWGFLNIPYSLTCLWHHTCFSFSQKTLPNNWSWVNPYSYVDST